MGPLQAQQGGAPVAIPGAKPRAILTMLGLHGGAIVSADTLIELLWGDDPPRTAAKALQTHISALRRTLGDGVVLTLGTGWTLADTEVDASRYKVAARLGRDAAAAGNTAEAVASFEEALSLWRGVPELPDGQRGSSEKTRWIEAHAALVEDRADALLATGRAAEIVGELEAAVSDAPLRERRWGQLMLALYRAGRQGEALGAYQRARSLLADQLGVDPGPELRRLEAAIVGQDAALDTPVAQQASSVTRAVTFLLTDIEGSTAAWEADADAMAAALARHDELVEHVVTSRGGRLIKTRGEGDATFSVFDRPSAAAAAAIELQDAIAHEPWTLGEPLRIRVALHTGEVELRDGDYFGRAVNRAARLRSLAAGGQILCSGATAELVVDSLSDDVVLADLGVRQLRNLARPEHVFELRMQTDDEELATRADEAPVERPDLPAVLTGHGPFVGRGQELQALSATWQSALTGSMRAVLIAGEPGVGKTRLAGEWSRQAYEQDAAVLYGRCDEDLGAPYQPFAEALRSLVPCLAASRLRGLRGVEALLPLVPGLTDVLPDLAAPTRADPDTERYALFDAVVALLESASVSAPVILILDDLHWAAKSTLLLLRHLLRFGDQARVQIVGTYRSTDLDRSHPLAAMLADLHRDGTAERLALSGLDEDDVTTYVAEAGYDDEELGRALASVTGGNPFFLIEALRHVDESGGVWDQSTLPQGVREAVSRRLSRLPAETNKALAAAAVVGSRFAVDMVERVIDQDLVDAFDEACKAGIVIEEPGGRYRFNHALIRQSLLAELPSVRRMRLHQRIATTLENKPGADDELLAELAHHYFECAWAGNAAKAVEYCRRAADQAMARLAYEGAADLYDHALHALEEIDDELPDREDQTTELLVARCEALLAAGDVASAAGAVTQLQEATRDSARIAAWAACYDGQLSMLVHPDRLDAVESTVGAAADTLAELRDAAGEAKAHTVRALALGRLGRIGDSEIALDRALTAARRAREHRRVNAVLAVAPLAALWGPNPVPRAGGRCLDVVRLLRITTDSPAVEATSTRCQAVLEAFRGRESAARRMIDSARRTVSELGLRHALLEVEQFAGIVELVVDDPSAAEPHLRKAYNGFRRMGLDADTAETAALLGRACLALDRDAEADELCSESERLAGHALKASIAWRTLRAHLLSRRTDHNGAIQAAEAAIALAERTDALVDHGDACLALATVLGAAGDAAGSRAAAGQAVDLYERKGAAALADGARAVRGQDTQRPAPASKQAGHVPTNEVVRVGDRLISAVNRKAWDEVERLFAPEVRIESRRKIVGFASMNVPAHQWPREMSRYYDAGMEQYRHTSVEVRGERLALFRIEARTADSSPGAPLDEMLEVISINADGLIAQQVWFDLDDMDAAITELDAAYAALEEATRAPRLENAASRMYERFKACYASRDMDTLAEIIADDICTDDRRRVVNAGVRRGREAAMAEIVSFIEVGALAMSFDVTATRGDRLILNRSRIQAWDQRSDLLDTEVIEIIEIDADERLVRRVLFDTDDIDGASTELEARYLAGEAAPFADTWSAVAEAYASLHRHRLPALAPDFVDIDHRSLAPIGSGDLVAYIGAAMNDLAPGATMHVEAVQRLSDLGAVISHSAHGVTPEGVDAEWRMMIVVTVAGEALSRVEIFDEVDLDAALARFEELHPHERRLENAATRVSHRYAMAFASRDWVAVSELLADDFCIDDRRPTVNGGIRLGRKTAIEDLQAAAGVGFAEATGFTLATRGERLALTRAHFSGDGEEPFENELLNVIEIDADERMAAVVVFETDDVDAALAELDARYLAGEAAPHATTWSLIAEAYTTLNAGGFPPAAPDYAIVDHRLRTTIEASGFADYMDASRKLTPNLHMYVEAVHRLSDVGTVVTHGARGTSTDGFDADWRIVEILTVENGLCKRCELFEEADLDKALARFDELQPKTRKLENAASRAYERAFRYFEARNWAAMADAMAPDVCDDDRRRVANGGVQRGPDHVIANSQNAAALGATSISLNLIAVRGDRLALSRLSFFGPDPAPDAFHADVLAVVEIDNDEKFTAYVAFDSDDFDAAVAELDARYMSGEGAAYAHTWSVVTKAHAAFNRRELFSPTPELLDHRPVVTVHAGEPADNIRDMWEFTPDLTIYIETVHQLSDHGAVLTQASHGTSQKGFEAEWRVVELIAAEGDLVTRCELFEETDLDTALARFEELHPQKRRLENAASRMLARFLPHFATREWEVMAEMLTADISLDDRRRVINGGVLRGRNTEMANVRAIADAGVTEMKSTPVATRGERLVLHRLSFYVPEWPEEQNHEILEVVEITVDGLACLHIAFDPDDFDAAVAELDARYMASQTPDEARIWSVATRAQAALDHRRQLPHVKPGWVNIDHRHGISFAPGDMTMYVRAGWGHFTNAIGYIEIAHAINDRGAVYVNVFNGSSLEGFDAEWRFVELMMVDGDLISHVELFDEDDLDAALARFDELSRPRLENAATRLSERLCAYFADRAWDTMAQSMADSICSDDRRRVVGAGIRHTRAAAVEDLRAIADVGFTDVAMTTVATRGHRLALTRNYYSGREQGPLPFHAESVAILEIDADDKLAAAIVFDLDEIDAAFAELEARYLAGEAAPHASCWSSITEICTALNRRELPETTVDWVTLDHRRGASTAPGDWTADIRAAYQQAPDIGFHISAVHRLSDVGAVMTGTADGTSREGFEAEWRLLALFMVNDHKVSRVEIFDEDDLDAALALFDEVAEQKPRLHNESTRIWERTADAFNRRDLAGFLSLSTTDGSTVDRRKGLHSEVKGNARRKGLQAVLDVSPASWRLFTASIAIRGTRLSLTRVECVDFGLDDRPATAELLVVMEADNGLTHNIVCFDIDDIDAAFAELDSRYLAGEGAVHAHAWSIVAGAYAALNSQQLPARTTDCVMVDRRSSISYEGDGAQFLNATWEMTSDIAFRIEAVHRLTDLGAVVAFKSYGTSEKGFAAEWRALNILTIEGNLISRGEIFDESELETALARFDELGRQAPENPGHGQISES